MPDPSTILTSISALASVGSVALIWFGKTWFTTRLENAIRHEYDEKIERLKAQLEAANSERSIRYTRVFEQIAGAISETHSKLFDVMEAIEPLTRKEPPSSALETFYEKFKDFERQLPRARLYLPETTASQLNALSVQFIAGVLAPEQDLPGINNEIGRLLKLLESDFRKTLGLEQGPLGPKVPLIPRIDP